MGDCFALLFLKNSDHLPHATMLATGSEDFQTFFLRAPFQNVNVYMADAPAVHFKPARLVEVDGIGADHRRPVIVDDIFFLCIGNSESGPERKVRPIRRSTHHMRTRKPAAERVVAPASALAVRISGSAHIRYVTRAGDSRCRMRGTACNQASYSSCKRKVKASRHLQYRALNNSPSRQGQAINCRISLGVTVASSRFGWCSGGRH